MITCNFENAYDKFYVENDKPIPHIFDLIFKKKTKYQTIELGKIDNRVILLLDKHTQFIYPDERFYHEGLIKNPIMMMKRKPKRVLILGGGDGMAAREALKYGAEEVVMVELDGEMISLFKNHPFAARLNDYSLNDKRVKVIVGDAYKVPSMGLGKFDLIASDLTDPNKLSAHLYSLPYLKKLIEMLNSGGILSGYGQYNLVRISKIRPFISKRIADMGILKIYYYQRGA